MDKPTNLKSEEELRQFFDEHIALLDNYETVAKDALKIGGLVGEEKELYQEVEELEKLFDADNFDEVIKTAPAIFDQYKYLGWADTIAALQCESFLALGKPGEASAIFQNARKFPAENMQKFQRVLLLEMLAKKEFDRVENELKRMILDKDDSKAAFAFNMKGQLYEAKGQKREAILEYLKTVILFEGKGKLKRERDVAKQKAVALMKELKDPRVAKIEALK